MNKNWLKQNLLLIIFVIFVANYTILLLINTQLGPTDDFIFLRTLQVGKPILYYSQNFPYYDAIKLGRFVPLAAMEYNLVGLFSKSPSAFWYYFVHAIQFILLMILLAKLLSKFTSNKILIYITPILLSLTQGFTMSWFRLQLNERNVIFFLVIFLLCYLAYFKNQKIVYLVLGLIAANIAIYYRETAFIAIGAFAFFHLLISWKTISKKIKIFDGLLLLSSSIYLLLYYFFIVYSHQDQIRYALTPYNSILIFIKNVINYAFLTDPVLILILLPFAAWRIFQALFKHQKLHPLYDSMLITASIYIVAFFILNICAPRYLLPAYIFGLPPLFALFFAANEQKKLIWKSALAITGLVFLFNVLPSGIHYLTWEKYLPINFNKTLNFLVQDINTNHPHERANIFLDKLGRDGEREIYFILGEFLQFKGLSSQQFDLKSDVESKNPSSSSISKPSGASEPFTVLRTDKPDKISPGDYLVVEALNSKKDIDKDYIQSLNKDYELIFQTNSAFAFPDINLKTLAKIFFSRRLSYEQKAKSALFKGLAISENFMHWPDYYVFIRK